jgi:hypothetical protein
VGLCRGVLEVAVGGIIVSDGGQTFTRYRYRTIPSNVWAAVDNLSDPLPTFPLSVFQGSVAGIVITQVDRTRLV